MSTILFNLALYAFPPLFLLLFYSLKNRRLVWLTIPASALALLLCCGIALFQAEFLGTMLMLFALHTTAVSVVTAIAAIIKSRAKKQPKKRTLIIIAAAICAVALGFVAHAVLADTSANYQQKLDRPVFKQLTQIQPEDVVRTELSIPDEIYGGKVEIIPYQGGMEFFADLEYLGPALSKFEFEMPRLRGEPSPMLIIALRDGDSIRFILCKDDIFEVYYKDRVFFVKSPQLLADIP